MKVEHLTLLTAKSMKLELSSKNHDSITSEDILHYLASKKLSSQEYDFLVIKYLKEDNATNSFVEDLMLDAFDLFKKNKKCYQMLLDKKINLRHICHSALREVIYTYCFFCNGRGRLSDWNNNQKCTHCNGTGQFDYNDSNRPQIIGIDKNTYDTIKKIYAGILEIINDIEISALKKIGDA